MITPTRLREDEFNARISPYSQSLNEIKDIKNWKVYILPNDAQRPDVTFFIKSLRTSENTSAPKKD